MSYPQQEVTKFFGIAQVTVGSSVSIRRAVRHGSSLSVIDFTSLASSVSLRSFLRVGSGISVLGDARVAGEMSVMDCLSLGTASHEI